MDSYRFDRTAFKIKTFAESDADNVDLSLPLRERLRQAYYLISKAYGFDVNNPPRMDKTVFSYKKLNK
ncbi:hypothetical protein MMC2321_04290 [Chitinophaga sp. MM2321]